MVEGGPGTSFYDNAHAVVDTARTGMLTVQAAIEDMFDTALTRAEAGGTKGKHKYKGDWSWEEDRYKSYREPFADTLGIIEQNISELSTLLPTAGQIGREAVSEFQEGGEFSWLEEGYQDTVTY